VKDISFGGHLLLGLKGNEVSSLGAIRKVQGCASGHESMRPCWHSA
jgi:hypothetical protein